MTASRWLAVVLAAAACSSTPRRDQLVHNVSRGCGYVYEAKPGAYTVLVIDDRVVWIDDGLNQINLMPVDGGDRVTLETSERLGSIYEVIVVGTDLVVADAEQNAVRRISLADGTVTTVVDGIRHPYALAYAGGVYFIGGEDELYRFDPATKDLTELHEGTAMLAARGNSVYVALEDRLLAIDARNGKEAVLVTSRSAVDGSDEEIEPIALVATDRGPVWSAADGGIWAYELATRRSRRYAQLAHPVVQILAVGSDLYLAAGAEVQRLRAGRLETIPIDKQDWEDPDDPRTRVTAIGLHRDVLVYHAPYAALASTCLPSAQKDARHGLRRPEASASIGP